MHFRAGFRKRVLGILGFLAAAMTIVPGPAFAYAAPVPPDKTPPQASAGSLPLNFERHTDDLDAMVKRRTIRALVLYSRSGFFYVNGRPQGIYYEALRAFEQSVNEKLHTGKQPVQVTFIPVRPDQVEKALTEGVGDLIAYALTVTPEREQRVAFSPIETDVKQIVVTGKGFGPVASLQDLSGKKIFVNPLTTYPANLAKVNDSLRKQGKPPILIESADKNLLDEDLLEMVNAGIIPATVTITDRAKLWASVLPDITPQPNLVIADEGTLAWAMRKNNPKLKAVVDEFTKSTHGGNVVRQHAHEAVFAKHEVGHKSDYQGATGCLQPDRCLF